MEKVVIVFDNFEGDRVFKVIPADKVDVTLEVLTEAGVPHMDYSWEKWQFIKDRIQRINLW